VALGVAALFPLFEALAIFSPRRESTVNENRKRTGIIGLRGLALPTRSIDVNPLCLGLLTRREAIMGTVSIVVREAAVEIAGRNRSGF